MGEGKIQIGEEEMLRSIQSLVVGDENKNREKLKRIEDVIGYEFNNVRLLEQAFTHHSYVEGCSSLERLAYYGDAILNFAITKDQIFLYPDLYPGPLTRLRAANVDTEKLARVALKYRLHNFLRHNIFLLRDQIDEFRDAIEEYPLHSSGLIDAPKVLADMVESLIGAVFIDSNSLDRTWEVTRKLLEPIITPETLPIHPVTQLLELCQSRRLKLKMIDSWKETGVIEFVIEEKFVGRAKFKAKRAIAKNRAAFDAYKKIVSELDLQRLLDYDDQKLV